MKEERNNPYNPNPITKFFVAGLLGFTVLHTIPPFLEWGVVGIISWMYFINHFKKEGIRHIIIFGILYMIPNFSILEKLPFVIQIMLSIVLIMRMFYLPYIAGKFLVQTSDVGSMISSMDFLKIPQEVSIAIAVMFRFFPSFVEEKNHIRMAMKIRGITMKNPIRYIEYVIVPMLILSSNIADDIAKAAETKGIANPIKKTRYASVGMQKIDFIYAATITAIVAGGWLCSN